MLLVIRRPCGPPPPEQEYEPLANLQAAIDKYVAQHGYDMVKDGTSKGWFYFRCAKGRQAKSCAQPGVHENKRRKTST